MTPPIDLDRLRIPGNPTVPPTRSRTPPRHCQGEKFLKGPIPLEWLIQAARLPGRTLHVGIALWHQVGLISANHVPLSMKLLRSMRVDRSAVYRALHALEDAELVAVVRRRGHQPHVTILNAPRHQVTRD